MSPTDILNLISGAGVADAESAPTRRALLLASLFAGLPLAGSGTALASPLDSSQRGPYGCFAARSPEKTAELYHQLVKEKVITSLREGNIRVSPHLYNTERDIDRLIAAITV